MHSLVLLIEIAGAVALLLTGLGLVREGVTAALGVRLKVALGLGTRNTPRAFLTGLLATLGLQSSTATALIVASFAERGMIRGAMAQVAMLGANLGTALTAWIIAAGFDALAPALVLMGYVARRRGSPAVAGAGLALIGVGLMLLSLSLLGMATAPLREAPAMAAFLRLLDGAWPVAALVSAALAALFSSSLAMVMLILALAPSPGLAVAMVLGANLGGAVPPLLLTAQSGPAARRVTLGNLLARALGCALVLPFAEPAGAALAALPLPRTALAVAAHLGFNLALSVALLPLAAPLARIVARLLPDAAPSNTPGSRWLDEAALSTPALALTGASREALAIGDIIERMLVQTQTAFRSSDDAPLAEVSALEGRVDRVQQEVKTYLSRLGPDAGEDERRRAIIVLDYVINLEHMGDIIDRGLATEVRKKVSLGLRFSDDGYSELDAMFLITLENLRLAQTIFLSRDRALARQLMESKVDVRRMERQSAQRHLLRLREGQAQSHETSSLHLDMLRDLKRLNAHIVSVAHPILDEDGLLIESRLKSG